ncbi:hypothetical protein IQ243_29005 [Nostocales cyanobacterium LEGE 11386]|nr:hypothetical protein [Nostocales cyanobacterium LEGE 11386]
MLSFKQGQGFVYFLPQVGFGVWGGWVAYALYMAILGSTLWWRWQYSRPKDAKQTKGDK